MALYLWWEWARVERVTELVDALGIAGRELRLPREWIDLLTDDPVERAKWRNDEYRRVS